MATLDVDSLYYVTDNINSDEQLKQARRDLAMGKRVALIYPDDMVEIIS